MKSMLIRVCECMWAWRVVEERGAGGNKGAGVRQLGCLMASCVMPTAWPVCACMSIHTYTHTQIHTYIPAAQPCMVRTCGRQGRTCMRTYVRTYVHTCTRAI
jgi:hypothetical protein